jgi:glucose/arabinose dehydrogenase
VTDEERLDLRGRVGDVIEAPNGAIVISSHGRNSEVLRLNSSSGAAQ